MDKLINDMFARTSGKGISIKDVNNNHIINEAIILDMVGDKKALGEVFDKLGKFASRDGLLSESADFDCKLDAFDKPEFGTNACVLACAKEAGDEDYDLYMKSLMLAKTTMEKLCAKYGEVANKRHDEHEIEIKENPRVIDAIENVTKPVI